MGGQPIPAFRAACAGNLTLTPTKIGSLPQTHRQLLLPLNLVAATNSKRFLQFPLLRPGSRGFCPRKATRLPWLFTYGIFKKSKSACHTGSKSACHPGGSPLTPSPQPPAPKSTTKNPQTSTPKPRTPHPKPQTSNPKLQTPNPKPQTPNLRPQTLNPEPGGIGGAAQHCQTAALM